MRIEKTSSLLPEVDRGRPIQIVVDGQPVTAYEGETVATVLLAEGHWHFRRTPRLKQPRGLYCGMGVCFECLVSVDGVHAVRACLTPVVDGMRIDTCEELTL
jgi:predicted molibdopterin-dependent oxidoreductase YjgC